MTLGLGTIPLPLTRPSWPPFRRLRHRLARRGGRANLLALLTKFHRQTEVIVPRDRSKIAMICLAIIGVACVVAGIVMFGAAQAESRAAMSWPSTPAHVDESRVEQRMVRNAAAASAQTFYRLVLSFSYEVGGRRYTSDRFSLSGPSESDRLNDMEELQARFPGGSTATAYYDPANPAQAVLDRSAPVGGLGIAIGVVGLVFLLTTGLIWFLMRRATR